MMITLNKNRDGKAMAHRLFCLIMYDCNPDYMQKATMPLILIKEGPS